MCGDTIERMLEELDALTEKLREIGAQLRALRDENQRLRTQLANANVELDEMKTRVAGAMQRIDSLLDQLPLETRGEDATTQR